MAILNVNPTRMELGKIKSRLEVAVKGHRLLKDKRDELMRQFLKLCGDTKELRRVLEQKMTEVNRGIALAGAAMQRPALVCALMLPIQSVTLKASSKSIMGVDVPVFSAERKSGEESAALPYGYAFTSGELDNSIKALSDALPDMLRLAGQEKAVQLLAAEIEKTRRRVNALEYTVIPNYRETVRYITMKLDENERSNLARLMKVKDMMVKKQIQAHKQRTESFAEDSAQK